MNVIEHLLIRWLSFEFCLTDCLPIWMSDLMSRMTVTETLWVTGWVSEYIILSHTVLGFSFTIRRVELVKSRITTIFIYHIQSSSFSSFQFQTYLLNPSPGGGQQGRYSISVDRKRTACKSSKFERRKFTIHQLIQSIRFFAHGWNRLLGLDTIRQPCFDDKWSEILLPAWLAARTLRYKTVRMDWPAASRCQQHSTSLLAALVAG